MKGGHTQLKDIADAPIIQFLGMLERGEIVSCWEHLGKLEHFRPKWATLHPGFANSIDNALPGGTSHRGKIKKLQSMIDRGLITGCTCGCRGDFELTDKGRAAI